MSWFTRKARHAQVTPPPPPPARWEGSGVDWAAHGVPPERTDLAVELAACPDFGVDRSLEPDFQWALALYDDVRGLAGDAAIEAMVDWLPTVDGVDEVLWADREDVWVKTRLNQHELAVAVVARLAETADPDYWVEQDDGTVQAREEA